MLYVIYSLPLAVAVVRDPLVPRQNKLDNDEILCIYNVIDRISHTISCLIEIERKYAHLGMIQRNQSESCGGTRELGCGMCVQVSVQQCQGRECIYCATTLRPRASVRVLDESIATRQRTDVNLAAAVESCHRTTNAAGSAMAAWLSAPRDGCSPSNTRQQCHRRRWFRSVSMERWRHRCAVS